MSETKKYYWLKLRADFFKQKEIKKLRKIAGGDTYTIIYLKMQLLTMKSDGILTYDGIEETFEEEIALELDEDIDNVKITMAYLKSTGLLEILSENEAMLPDAVKCIGKESDSAERVRRHREKKALQCNRLVTNSNTELEIEIEKEIEKEIEIKKPQPQRFVKPLLEDIRIYLKQRGVTSFKADQFYDYYESKGWLVGKTPMKNWQAAIRTWERNDINKGQAPAKINTYVPEYVPPEDRPDIEDVNALRKAIGMV